MIVIRLSSISLIFSNLQADIMPKFQIVNYDENRNNVCIYLVANIFCLSTVFVMQILDNLEWKCKSRYLNNHLKNNTSNAIAKNG
jgi:hypothetical protein